MENPLPTFVNHRIRTRYLLPFSEGKENSVVVFFPNQGRSGKVVGNETNESKNMWGTHKQDRKKFSYFWNLLEFFFGAISTFCKCPLRKGQMAVIITTYNNQTKMRNLSDWCITENVRRVGEGNFRATQKKKKSSFLFSFVRSGIPQTSCYPTNCLARQR